jgi:hypothetical protein
MGSLQIKRSLFHCWPLSTAAAQDARKVRAALYIHKTLVAQQGVDGMGLVKAMLKQQPAAGFEVLAGLAHDEAKVVHAIGP